MIQIWGRRGIMTRRAMVFVFAHLGGALILCWAFRPAWAAEGSGAQAVTSERQNC